MKNKNAHEYYAQGVQKEALLLPFFEKKTAKQAVPNTFSHPDCTVGLGFAPSQSLSTAYDSESRAQTCVRHYRRSGIAPYPEGWYSVRQSIAYFYQLAMCLTVQTTLQKVAIPLKKFTFLPFLASLSIYHLTSHYMTQKVIIYYKIS